MTRTIAVVSHKGGTGKTSLAQNLGHEFSQAKQRTLLVDFDPQSTLTIGCGLDPGADRPTIYHAMTTPNETPNIVIRLPYYDIMPSNLDLAYAEQEFAGHFDRNDKLKDALAPVRDRYDVILIDSPPSLGFFAFNALMAATEAVIPLQVQPYAYRMLDSTLRLIELVRKGNPTLKLTSIVLTLYDRRVTLTKSVEDAARTDHGTLVAQSVIPTNISIAEATLEGTPVAVYDPTSTGAQSYRELAQELMTDGEEEATVG